MAKSPIFIPSFPKTTMGRWCWFSNGFDYKFWFGVQASGFDCLAEKGIVDVVISNEIDLNNYLDNIDDDDRADPVVRSFIKWAEDNVDNEGLTTDNAPWRSRTRSSTTWNNCIKEAIVESQEMFEMTVDRDALLTYLQSFNYKLPEFDKYDTDAVGTKSVYDEIEHTFGNEQISRYENVQRSTFALGCIVYHLSKDGTVRGSYEL
jgi:hypothetical protein